MSLRKLDIFLHIPGETSDYSDKLKQDAMGSIEPPALDKKRTRIAAIKIMEAMSKNHNKPLEWLTLHITRTGYEDRAQPYLMHAGMQLRRSKGNGAAAETKYEVRGKMKWFGLSSLDEELIFEEE
jgi:hypothetical protein